MSFADQPSGQRLPAILVTALVHAAGLALAVSAFHVAQAPHGRPDGLQVTVLRSQSSPVPAKPPEPKKRQEPDQRAKTATPRPTGRTSPAKAQTDTSALRPTAIAEPAQMQSPSPSTPAPAKPQDAGARKEDVLAAYANRLRQRILERRPRGLRNEGTVTVAFRLDRSGQITGSNIAVSSGDIRLDRLALRMVRHAAPFPSPPDEVPDAKLDFSLSIHFH